MSELTERFEAAVRPLEQDEAERAMAAVLRAVRERYGDPRLVVHGAEVRVEKPRRGEAPERLVRVLVDDLTNHGVHEAGVDARGDIVAIELRRGLRLPYLPEETAAARRLADEHDEVRDFFGDAQPEVSAFAPGVERDDGHRRIGLHLLAADREPVRALRVVVDLADGVIDSIEREG
jgi:hypothetical protein